MNDSSSQILHPGRSASQRKGLVIVPAFNESDSVGRVVEQLIGALPDFDVVVIDDGSTDATVHRVPDGAKLITLPFNLGIGGAMQTGYRYAAIRGYDVAVQVDADGQHPPAQVRELIEQLEKAKADMVVGSRFLGASGYHVPWLRRTGIAWLRTLLRCLSGKTFTDCTSGFRAVNHRAIHAFAHWYPTDYPEPEVILLLHRSGFTIAEYPIPMQPRVTGETSIPLGRGLFYVIKVSAALLLDMFRQPWPWEKVDMS
jgi:hypothetical protein